MPLYEFECGKCKGQFELLTPSRQAADSVRCTACGSRRVRRLMSTFVGRRGSSGGTSAALAGADSCSGCRRTSCAGCRSG